MDNTIMIHAGHYVDCTLGVTFGLSTLAAAVRPRKFFASPMCQMPYNIII